MVRPGCLVHHISGDNLEHILEKQDNRIPLVCLTLDLFHLAEHIGQNGSVEIRSMQNGNNAVLFVSYQKFCELDELAMKNG